MEKKAQLNISIHIFPTYRTILKTTILADFARGAKSREAPLL